MIDIFVGLRDLHTNYLLPSVYQAKAAYLPFRVEEFYEGERAEVPGLGGVARATPTPRWPSASK